MKTVEIRDNSISAEDIMYKIRDNIRKRKENGVYTEDMDISTDEQLQTFYESSDDDLRHDLIYVNSNTDIRAEYNISSHRPIIGRLLVLGRRFVHGEIKRYVDIIIGKQSEFNVHVVHILNMCARYNKDIDNKIGGTVISMNKDIDNKIGGTIISMNKDIDNKISETIISMNKDIDNKISEARLNNVNKGIEPKWRELYKQDITEDSMKRNIEHHNYFMSIIDKYATSSLPNTVPRLIEVGIGTATMSIHLSRALYGVLGIDNDPIIVSMAMDNNIRLGGYAKFVCLDIFDIQKFFREKLFDVAFSQGTLEHFDNDTLKKIIDAQLYVAKRVIFSVPSLNYPYSEFGNERKMSVNEWEMLLKSFGYTVEHISYYQEGDWHIACVILA